MHLGPEAWSASCGSGQGVRSGHAQCSRYGCASLPSAVVAARLGGEAGLQPRSGVLLLCFSPCLQLQLRRSEGPRLPALCRDHLDAGTATWVVAAAMSDRMELTAKLSQAGQQRTISTARRCPRAGT